MKKLTIPELVQDMLSFLDGKEWSKDLNKRKYLESCGEKLADPEVKKNFFEYLKNYE